VLAVVAANNKIAAITKHKHNNNILYAYMMKLTFTRILGIGENFTENNQNWVDGWVRGGSHILGLSFIN
jgi:hypothetical protein